MWDKIVNENYYGYFFRILKNNLNDFLKKKYQIEFIPLEDNDNFNFFESQNENGVSLLNLYKIELEKILHKLSQKEQYFYKLKYKDMQTYTQIAQQLNITVNNAKVQNNRLVKKIITLYEKKYE